MAILIKQSRPFPLLGLPPAVRKTILAYVLKPEPEDSSPIKIICKQAGTRAPYAPSYHAKNKLAIALANKELHEEATPIIFENAFNFPKTQVLTAWLTMIGRNVKYLRKLSCETYEGFSACQAFCQLNCLVQ